MADLWDGALIDAAINDAPKVTRYEASARSPLAISQNWARLSELALNASPDSGSRMSSER